jgi:leucyl/phenylalanyl-tRNA---protein transferase
MWPPRIRKRRHIMSAHDFTGQYPFPDPRKADAEGLVACGGDLNPRRILSAYAQGIFPWPYDSQTPLLWFSPDPRMVLRPEDLHVSKSLQKIIGRRTFDVRFDTAFEQVITFCATVRRPGQRGTWITDAMIRAYIQLHEMGFAHSAEAWREGTLAGGLYGVSLGAVFFGESMFTRQPNASKVAFVHLVRRLQAWDFHLVDCQVYTGHLAHFGATPSPRAEFLKALRKARAHATRKEWRTDET